MKTSGNLVLVIGCASVLALNSLRAAEPAAAQNAPAESPAPDNASLQTGVVEEEAHLNPEAALAAYQTVIRRFDAQRPEAAQALFRTAEVLRKTGHLAHARRNYERIVREFADEIDLVRQSQRQLAAIRSTADLSSPEKTPWLLNVAFGSSLRKQGKAATGYGTNDYWNGYYLPWIDVVPLVNLMLWNGQITPIGMEIRNAAGTWSNNTGDPMYDAYVYVNDGSDKNIIITLTNLPAGRFDFYLYGHADPGGQGEGNSQFQITSGGKTTDWIGTARSAGWRADQPWTEGKQYVRFRGIEVNRDEPVMVTVRAGFDGAFTDPRNRPPVINGLQIVKTDGGGDSRNGLAITPYVAEPFSPAAELEKTQQSILQEREKSARNLQLLDALHESQNALRTQVLTDLQRRMVQVQERLTQADAQYEEASRLYTQAQGFKDRPELLPKPAASDPRYQKLKEALDQAQVAYLERPNDGDQTVKTKLESLHRFLHNTYLEELNVALKEADKTVKEYEFKLEELKNRLAAEQNRLKQEL